MQLVLQSGRRPVVKHLLQGQKIQVGRKKGRDVVVERLVCVPTFSPGPLEDGRARDVRESVVGGYPGATVTPVVTSKGLPGGSHAARFSPRLLPGLMVPRFHLLILVRLRGADANLDPRGVKRTVMARLRLATFTMHEAVLVAVGVLSPRRVRGAVGCLHRVVDGTVRAVFSLRGVEGAVGGLLRRMEGAFSRALVSCGGVDRAVVGT